MQFADIENAIAFHKVFGSVSFHKENQEKNFDCFHKDFLRCRSKQHLRQIDILNYYQVWYNNGLFS
jgi:hypothetical protein